MKRTFLLFLILFFSIESQAQFRFQPKFDVSLSVNGESLSRAWEGGLNAAQFQSLDLNFDGEEDLVVYHRISREITTYLYLNGRYQRSPAYDQVFPEDTRSLLLLKDFDCDGLKDLFTTTSLGIKVYKNVSSAQEIRWSVAKDFLTFDGGSNIQMTPSDIPGLADVNGDGALDILTFRFGNANSIDFYLNTGECGSLEFTRSERRWGDFEECGCNDFVFGQACPTSNSVAQTNKPESITHIGGKTILLFDADNDGDQDLITSDETCETLYFMENIGDAQNARMTQVNSYPLAEPAAFPFFPSAFFEDIDRDGLLDLLISTNADENIGNQISLTDHIKYYPNVGNENLPNFQSSSPFLQSEMLDLGEETFPELTDLDGDGDLDLIVGQKGRVINEGFRASLYLFENTGNPISPAFELVDDDFLELFSEAFVFIKPRFVDLDNDGDLDLTYQASIPAVGTQIYFRENQGNQAYAPALSLPINVDANDNPFWYDINDDGLPDLLLGKRFGSLSLFINEGNLLFDTEQRAFAGLIDDFERLNLNVIVEDLDGNGVDDLLTTDLSGQVRAYRGPVDEDFLATNPISAIYFPTPAAITSSLGIQNALAFGDLFGSGLPTILLGSLKGGLLMLENISENNDEEKEDIIIRVRPNPSIGEIRVLTNANGVLEIINLNGQKILENMPVVPGNELIVNTSRFPKGVYVIRIISDTGQRESKKVIFQ